ncbi:MAG TPA: flagellar biosynthetic protein FliR [Planctomycetota bacterium]|nr:flagellar biosynthetic protein FliR [Planctomycetota bacterium]
MELLGQAPGTLAALGLYGVRVSALILAAPLFGTASSFSGHRVGLIAVLSLALYAASGTPLRSDGGPLGFAALALRETLIGLSLAFVLQIVVMAVRVAGEMIGQEMAFNMATMVDPATGVNTPLITQIHESLFLIGLLAIDGHHVLLRALADSFARAPVGTLGFDGGLVEGLQRLFGEMFAAGLTFAAPVLVLLFLVSLVIGLLARAVPQLNVLEVGFTLRIAAALVAMYAFAPLLAPAMERLFGAMAVGLDGVLAAVEG